MGTKKPKPVLVTTYSVGIQFIACNAPVDSVRRIDVDEKTVWEGNLTDSGSISVYQPELFGGLKREGGIKGTVSFNFGKPSEAVNTYLAGQLGAIPAFRSVLSIVLEQVWLGTNYYIKPWRFLCTRIQKRMKGNAQWQPAYASPSLPSPSYDFLYIYTGGATSPETFGLTTVQVHTGYFVRVDNIGNPLNGKYYIVLDDSKLDQVSGFTLYTPYPLINAVHVIRECLTDSEWGMSQEENSIDEPSFLAAAITCFNEGLGFSWLYTKDRPVNEFIDEVSKHINAQVYRDRITNLWKITLIRKISDPSGLFTLTIDNIQKIPALSRGNLADVTNMVLIKYLSNLTFKPASHRLPDANLIARQGKVVLKSLEFAGIATPEVAQLIAARELQALSTPVFSGQVICNREALVLNPGDAFILPAISPLTNPLVLRVNSINLGSALNEAVTIDFVEDAFSAADTIYLPNIGGEWTPPDYTPVPVLYRLLEEIPYYLLAQMLGDVEAQNVEFPETGFIEVAVAPSSTSLTACLYVSTGGTLEKKGEQNFCFSALLTAGMDRITSAIGFDTEVATNFLEVGVVLQVDEELICVTSFDLTLRTMVVQRGILDTVPEVHLDNARIWGVEKSYATDKVTYLAGETIHTKLLTETPQGVLDIADATEDTLLLVGRPHLPYPPGNFKIDTVSWDSKVSDAGEYEFTWTSRNRLQQTTATFLDYYSGSVTSEAGVTYNFNLLLDLDDTPLYSSIESGLSITVNVEEFLVELDYPAIVRVELNSETTNGISFQTVSHIFTIPALIFKADDGITQFTDSDDTTLLSI